MKTKIKNKGGRPYTDKIKMTHYISRWVVKKLRLEFPKGVRGRFVEDAIVEKAGWKKPKEV